MDAVIANLEKIKLLIATLIAIVSLVIAFRRQILELIDFKRGQWKKELGDDIRDNRNKVQLKSAARLPDPDVGTQTGREVMLEAWGTVKQAVRDGCIANRLAVSPTVRAKNAVQQLAVKEDLKSVISILDERGWEVHNYRWRRPADADARDYQILAYRAAAALGEEVLAPVAIILTEHAPPPEPQRRATVVGGSFLPPSPGHPNAVLVAIEGPLKGQQYPVDKSDYRIGRSANNDLRAAADNSVSSEHATLRYENGGLFLYDQDSRNGTFLNDQRVTRTPVMVRPGDRIRLGESRFEVIGASATARAR